jgi:hypothetical protein
VEKPTEPLQRTAERAGGHPPDGPEIGGMKITRRFFVTAVIAVCVLSAAIGSAISLVAQTGPAGPRGHRGATGPRGPQGRVDTRAIEAEIEAVRHEANIAGLEEQIAENEERIEELEGAPKSFSHGGVELCEEGEFFC